MTDAETCQGVLLCVDDEEYILNSLRRTFRNEPYKVAVARSGAEGLEVMEKEDVRVVISDQRMPAMLGTEFLSKVRDKWPHVIRIILSGYTEVPTLLSAINDGEVYHFVSKPWDDSYLRRLVLRAMEQSKVISEMMTIASTMRVNGDPDNRVGVKVKNMGNSIRMELSETRHPMEPEQIMGCLEKVFNLRKGSRELDLISGALVRENGKLVFVTEVGNGLELILEFPVAKREPHVEA